MSHPYPPEPWRLRGDMHASVWLVPWRELADEVPPGARAVRVGPYAVVATAWVDYKPGGVLAYRELMATVLVRMGWKPMPTVVRIWVDSPASRDGGRELWGIPKELAEFTFGGAEFAAADDSGEIARTRVRPGPRAPLPAPVAFEVVQEVGGRAKRSPVRARGRLGLSRSVWRVAPSGPLGFLAGRSPLLSVSLTGFRMRFGHAAAADAANWVRWSSA